MRRILIAGLVLPLMGGVVLAQAPSSQAPSSPIRGNPPVPQKVIPNQAPPEVIAPPNSMDKGAVVAPPMSPAADPNTVLPGQSGMRLSENDARQVLQHAGYTSVSALKQGPNGSWWGTAKKQNTVTKVMVDRKGVVTAN